MLLKSRPRFRPYSLSLDKLSVLRHVVQAVHVGGLDLVRPVPVHEREGPPYHVFSSLGQLVAEAAEELF